MILETNSEVGTPKRIQFPEGWIVKPLQEVTHCSFGGGTPSTTNPCFWNGPIPWITTAIINSEDIFLKCFQRGITQKALDSTSTQLAPKGSVLIGTRVGVGKVVVTTFDVAINQDITAFVLKENVDAEFLAYCMKQQAVQSWFEENKRGTTIKGVARNIILNLMIPLPSFPEQRAIARALRAVQAAREARLRELALERERKAALMERLFVQDNCKVMLLAECAFVQTGVAKGRKFENENNKINVPYLRVANVQDGYLDLEEIQTIEIRQSELKRFLLQPGDILLTEGGDFDKLGRGFIWQGQISQCVHQNHIFAVRVNKSLLIPEYLAYLIQSEYGKAYFLSVAHRTTHLACINSTKLKAFPTLKPDLDRQKEIVDVLGACDSRIAALDHEARLHDELFIAMLEELMSGRLSSRGIMESA